MNGMKIGFLSALLGVMTFGLVLFFLLSNRISFIMISIVLFFVLLIIVVVLGRYLKSETLVKSAQMKKSCPSCTKLIDRESIYCIHCGESVEEQIECDYCGTQNLITDTVCKECNAFLK